MKKYFQFIVALVLASVFVGCASTIKVYTQEEVKNKRITSFIPIPMPKTVLLVTAEVSETSVIPAKEPYSLFAVKLLGKKPFEAADPYYSIGAVSLSSQGKYDPDRVYFAKIDHGAFSTNDMTFTYNEDGFLSSASSSSKNLTIDYAVTVLEKSAEIAANAAVPYTDVDDNKLKSKIEKALTKHLKDDLEKLKADKPNEKEKIKALEELIAQDVLLVMHAYNNLIKLKETRSHLFNNNSPDVMALLADLDSKIAKITALFVGQKTKASANITFELELPKETTKSYDIFGLSKTMQNQGLIKVNPEAKLMSPLPGFLKKVVAPMPCDTGDADYADYAALKETHTLGVKFNIKPRPIKGPYEKLKTEGTNRGLVYHLPAHARIELLRNKQLSLVDTMLVSSKDHGVDAFLPPSTGSKELIYKVELNPITGALAKVDITSTAIDPNYVARVGDVGAGIAKARQDRIGVEATAGSELSQLTEQNAILTQKLEIVQKQKELEILSATETSE